MPICKGKFYKEIGTQVIGKLVGIVGTGNIGKQVAMMCKGLGLNVHVYDLYPDRNGQTRMVKICDF